MKPWRIRTAISLIIIVIFCLLAATFLFSIYTVQKITDNLKVQVNTSTVIITLKDNLSLLLNAETGERGYVITADTNYLEPYHIALSKISENLRLLSDLLKENPVQEIRLEKLSDYVNQKFAYIETIIMLKKKGDNATIKKTLTSGKGKYLMDQIRAFNQTLQKIEEKQFADRQLATTQSIRKTRIVFIIGAIISLVIILFLASVILNELNRRKKAERTMREYNSELKRKNAEIEQFAYIASHDLQQPLRSISNFTQLLDKKISATTDAEAREYMKLIAGGSQRMSTLIYDILEYSRIGKDSQKSTIDCNDLVRDILFDMNAIIQETNAEIHIGKLPVVVGYSYLKSLFQNLLSNALKFKKENVRPVINITARDTGPDHLFTIADNGIGIEEPYKERIFIIFQRLHSRKEYPGTGIGLSICKKIVDLHGGKIWVDSEPGKGSSFNFTIPKLAINET